MEFALADLQRDWIDGITGAAFVERVQAYRAQLEALPPEAQARGALLAEPDPIQFAGAFFAAVSLQITIILANPNWGAQEWDEFCGMVSPGIFFDRGFSPTVAPRAMAQSCEARHSSGDAEAGGTSRAPTNTILIPTGGTTGGVKLAIHTWDSLAAACRAVQDFLGGGAIDSCCLLPLYHVSGLMQLLRSFHTGGRIRFDEDELAGHCVSYVPTQLQRALASEARIRKLTTARIIFVGGAALPKSVAAQARSLKLPIMPVYGMTETAAMVAAVPTEDFLKDPSAGALPLGEARLSVEPDGRLRIQSPALFQGYLGRLPIDRAAGYLTGDAVRLDPGGRLHVLGRVDRLINSGGEKIDPAEVEAALLKIKGVREALVVGVPDAEWGQRVVAYYLSEGGVEVSSWKERLWGSLAPYKIPKKMILVEVLPTFTSVGASLVKTASDQAGSGSAGGTSSARGG